MKIAVYDTQGSKYTSYYRKQGIYCFDLVYDKNLASDLTIDECNQIMACAGAICEQYGASKMAVVE